MQQPLIYIILVNFNAASDTLSCLESLKKLNYSNFETIVIDNGSDDARALENQCTLIKTHQNLGFAEGNNVGIRYALAKGAEGILLLNNDTIVDPDMLNAFVKNMTKCPIMGSKLYLHDDPERFDHLGGYWNSKTAYFDRIAVRKLDDKQTFETLTEVDYVCGASLFARSDVFKRVGLLHSEYFLYWEESDFCMRAKKAGFTVWICPEAKVYHKVGASISGGKPFVTYFDFRNRLLWMERNCTPLMRYRALALVIFPIAFKLYRHRFLKHLQLFIKPSEQKRNELKYITAALLGIKDYAYRRFGNSKTNLV